MFLGRTLFLSVSNGGSSGASVISDRNYKLVSTNSSLVFKYSVELTLKHVKRNFKDIFINLSLVSLDDVGQILNIVRSNLIDTVFIDTSLIGNFAKYLRSDFPKIKIIAFFHNVEYQYFKDLIRVSKKPQHYLTIQLVKRAEKELLKCADTVIALNRRDSKSLQTLYGKEADLILPTSFDDCFDPKRFKTDAIAGEVLNLLFVGTYFFPNIYAVDWLNTYVLPYIRRKVKFHVVGNGFEIHKLENAHKSVTLLGRVEDLSEHYYMADLILAPIFHGSGMKTKVAEALMYNKPIFGTKEAFEGYDVPISTIGQECDTAKEFIDAIEAFDGSNFSEMRDVFLKHYSFDVAAGSFKDFFDGKRN